MALELDVRTWVEIDAQAAYELDVRTLGAGK